MALELCECTRNRPIVPESPERSSVESVDSRSKRSRLTFGGSTNGSRDAGGAFNDLGLGLAPGEACDATACDASSSSSSSSSCAGFSSLLQRSEASSGASGGSSSPAIDGLSPEDDGALAVRLSADACSTTQSGSSLLSDIGLIDRPPSRRLARSVLRGKPRGPLRFYHFSISKVSVAFVTYLLTFSI